MADLFNQTRKTRLDQNDRIAVGKPGEALAENIFFSDIKAQIGSELGVTAFRVNITQTVTNIPVQGLSGTDYEIVVDIYRTTQGASAMDMVEISNKSTSGFTVTIADPDFNQGTLIYRILNFNV